MRINLTWIAKILHIISPTHRSLTTGKTSVMIFQFGVLMIIDCIQSLINTPVHSGARFLWWIWAFLSPIWTVISRKRASRNFVFDCHQLYSRCLLFPYSKFLDGTKIIVVYVEVLAPLFLMQHHVRLLALKLTGSSAWTKLTITSFKRGRHDSSGLVMTTALLNMSC